MKQQFAGNACSAILIPAVLVLAGGLLDAASRIIIHTAGAAILGR